ncbi:MAG: hypothetical protein KBH12_06875 [Synergistaceae bacterium]|jgi:hypothetical protein|nr:hypothetical protein [Synergistaceae bacterium]MBP9957325.1 hypothetical protein [Synergistaceae bacterium]
MEKEKPYSLTLRLEQKDGRLFSALVSLNGTTAADVLRTRVKQYIDEYKHLLNLEEIE